MKIEDIMEMWREDSHIDDKDLDNESLKIPNLHQKYLDIYSKEKRKLSDLKTHWKVLFQQPVSYTHLTLPTTPYV